MVSLLYIYQFSYTLNDKRNKTFKENYTNYTKIKTSKAILKITKTQILPLKFNILKLILTKVKLKTVGRTHLCNRLYDLVGLAFNLLRVRHNISLLGYTTL